MEATVVDLRYKTSDILKALDRNESEIGRASCRERV